MSAIANQSTGYSAVHLKATGDSVAGRIVGHEDYQVRDFKTGQPKVFEKSGDPVMGVRIHLETSPQAPGENDSTKVTLWAEKVNMLKAISKAVRENNLTDIRIGDDLAVTRSGMDGQAITFTADYAVADEA